MSFRQFNRLAAKLCLFDLKGIKGLRLKCKTVSGVRMSRYGHHRLGCRAMEPSASRIERMLAKVETTGCWSPRAQRLSRPCGLRVARAGRPSATSGEPDCR